MSPCCTSGLKGVMKENGKKCRPVAHSGLKWVMRKVVKSTPCCTFWIKVVMWKMVQNDRKYPSIHPSIHPSGNHPIIFFPLLLLERERERW